MAAEMACRGERRRWGLACGCRTQYLLGQNNTNIFQYLVGLAAPHTNTFNILILIPSISTPKHSRTHGEDRGASKSQEIAPNIASNSEITR